MATPSYTETHANTLDQEIFQTISDYAIFEKLDQFVDKNLKWDQQITFSFQHEMPTFNTPNIEQISSNSSSTVVIPFEFLRTLHQNVKLKYPQQVEVRNSIFASAVEKHLWFEFGRLIVNKFQLNIPGKETYLLDYFSTLMLLNVSDIDSEYLLDATETYLLVNQSLHSVNQSSHANEIEMDESRYRLVVCLILGKDLNVNNANQLSHSEPFLDLLSDFSWGEKRLNQCIKLYRQKMLVWFEALSPHLKDSNQFKKWLEAEQIS